MLPLVPHHSWMHFIDQNWPCTMQCNEISRYDTHLCWCWQQPGRGNNATKLQKKKKKTNIGKGQISAEQNQCRLWAILAHHKTWAHFEQLWNFCPRQIVTPTSEGADVHLPGFVQSRLCWEAAAVPVDNATCTHPGREEDRRTHVRTQRPRSRKRLISS